MIKFEYDKLKAILMANAADQGLDLDQIFADFDDVAKSIASSAECVKPSDFLSAKPAQDDKLRKHILGCNFCRRLTKILWLAYIEEKERVASFESIFPDSQNRPNFDHCYGTFFVPDYKPPTRSCYNPAHILCFNNLSSKIKAHRRRCKDCDGLVQWIQKIEMPELV